MRLAWVVSWFQGLRARGEIDRLRSAPFWGNPASVFLPLAVLVACASETSEEPMPQGIAAAGGAWGGGQGAMAGVGGLGGGVSDVGGAAGSGGIGGSSGSSGSLGGGGSGGGGDSGRGGLGGAAGVGGKEPLALDSWTRHVIDSEKPEKSIFIASGDLDGDGKKDIVTGAWWYRNPGKLSTSWARSELGAPLHNMASVHDFDGDGDLDVLGTEGKAATANADFVWARNNGSGTFTILSNIDSGEGDFLQGIAVSPFFGENLQVALSWHKADCGVQLLTVPSKPATERWVWKRVTSYSQDEQLSAADIDEDGDLDLFTGTSWLENKGSSFQVRTVNDVDGSPDRNRLGDVDGDGDLDAVVGFEAISEPGKLAWYEQSQVPTEKWKEHVVSSTVVGPMSLDIADIDGDADLDIVVGEHFLSNPSAARLLIFENRSGDGSTWAQHQVGVGDEHHDGAQLVDIDGDGDLDIISIGWGHNMVLLYENRAR